MIGHALACSMKPPHRTAAAALAVALCCACGEAVPVQLNAIEPADGDEELIEDAFAILGQPFEFSNRRRGTINIVLVDLSEDRRGGRTIGREIRCYKALVASRHASTIAHELGHLLGLGHTCEPPDCDADDATNLMSGDERNDDLLTEEQMSELDKGRRRLTHCR